MSLYSFCNNLCDTVNSVCKGRMRDLVWLKLFVFLKLEKEIEKNL